jgi:hypothetical protein
MHDETFNYSVIKLIVSLWLRLHVLVYSHNDQVSLNEQFMVASLNNPNSEVPLLESQSIAPPPASKNRVLDVLMHRLGSAKTFGENMIFMLNRAGMFCVSNKEIQSALIYTSERTPEDLCMQLLVLKLLYLLFTTKGTSEYFYTNDLCVLVDVFLRELVDLDEESESVCILTIFLRNSANFCDSFDTHTFAFSTRYLQKLNFEALHTNVLK